MTNILEEVQQQADEELKNLIDFKKQSLRKRLIQIREVELNNLIDIWTRDGKNGNKPKALPTWLVCSLIMKEIPFVLFDNEEHTKIAMYLETDGIYTQNYGIIKKHLSWLEPSLNNNRADEVIYHIRNRAKIREKTQQPHLIPVGNGIYNRNKGVLEPFNSDYIFTTKVSTNYVENAPKPNIDGWDVDEWIKEIACYDDEIETLLWQVVNDSLNGNYTRKKAIFLVGEGNNSKGTYQDFIKYIVGGENVAYLKVDEFEKQFRTSVLFGKTVCIGDDVPVGVYIDDSSTFKSVVSGDPVLVEFKRKQPYSTNFYCTVIQSTNGMPRFKDKTHGNLRRILIVPFNADFNGSVENRNIKDMYIKDKSVLEYALFKAIKMDFANFIIPKASQEKMQSFMADNDPVYDFKIAVFDEWNKEFSIKYLPQDFVYTVYENFCDRNNYKPLSERKFKQQFERYLPDEWDGGNVRRITSDIHITTISRLAKREHVTYDVKRDKTYRSYQNNKIKAVN
ncbi:phage/plasmid primase, P4 family [Macrococcus sp. PK]|uniref:DNA primase family protein n=1 Tax=Macrococcus sp. PK TaxID=2801919 RepID=UPI001F0E2738|nr:phage/plasmid primase, P4 family [Macrococcus sp. PK]MCH4984914.1 nucleoside triphosphatase [Macrococcus sp. PK]